MPSAIMDARRFIPRFLAHLICVVAVAELLAACGDKREAFIGVRVPDSCSQQWPICDRIAGCLLGDQSYIEGRFPGDRLIGVQVFEPSTVTVSFQLEDVGATGEETAINFFEDRCRTRTRLTITGRTFVGEADKVGYVQRAADLSGVGDHLIEFSSDVHAHYILKVDVLPVRLKTNDNGP